MKLCYEYHVTGVHATVLLSNFLDQQQHGGRVDF
jgi:hypothetical protein